jgi:hypothetical protein
MGSLGCRVLEDSNVVKLQDCFGWPFHPYLRAAQPALGARLRPTSVMCRQGTCGNPR